MSKKKYVVFSNDVAPVHEGVYQREFSQGWRWAKFDDGGWYAACKSWHEASEEVFDSY